jgi:hypothetical protein
MRRNIQSIDLSLGTQLSKLNKLEVRNFPKCKQIGLLSGSVIQIFLKAIIFLLYGDFEGKRK